MAGRPKIGLSLLPEEDLRDAQLPLFAEGLVEAIEWTLDAEFDGLLPTWVEPLLDHYASAGVLYGHGVHFSPLSAVFEPRQARWLEQLSRVVGRRRYRHVSEHFGFSTVPGVSQGAPLPVPFVPAAVRVGRERLRALQDAVGGLPVGLENLALAMSRDDVWVHGEFLEQLLEPSGGFLLLDLHNLYCQAQNFDVAPEELVLAMPLARVRELHVSGGSWSPVQTPAGPRPFRRDTHDGPIPEEVLALLAFALPRCPQLEVVFVERLGGTLTSPLEVEHYREQYRRVA
ncbi:MAG: hypothetical protein RL033_6991, partial [Pseudomonadota bacterium]